MKVQTTKKQNTTPSVLGAYSRLAQRVCVYAAIMIIATELFLLYIHHVSLLNIAEKYLWVAPLLFFKSFIKKILFLNVYGIMQMILMIVWHFCKLLIIKGLKTVGIRYGTYFSQQKWKKASKKLRIMTKKMARSVRFFKSLIYSLSTVQFVIVVIAFLPILILLFLCGIGFRMTRDVMVKKSSEIGVTSLAVKTAQNKKGLINRMKQLDQWLLYHIERLTS